jgi:hypothetical protein
VASWQEPIEISCLRFATARVTTCMVTKDCFFCGYGDVFTSVLELENRAERLLDSSWRGWHIGTIAWVYLNLLLDVTHVSSQPLRG